MLKGLISLIGVTVSFIPVASSTSLLLEESSVKGDKPPHDVLLKVFPNKAERELMRKVAQCESGFAHEINGKVVKGVVNKKDTGLFQINDTLHGKRAAELGYDIRTVEGNALYAKYLFDKNGLNDWQASKRCWSSYFKVGR